MDRSRRIPILLSLATVLFSILLAPLLERVEYDCADVAFSFRYWLNARVFRRFQPLRTSSAEQDGEGGASAGLISDELCLIGIDSATLRRTGRYGSGEWIVRGPFLGLSDCLERRYRPSVLAFDILFQPVAGESSDPDDILGAGRVQAMIAALEDFQEAGVGAEPYRVLWIMSRFAAQLSETKLASVFAGLMQPIDPEQTPPISVICGYIFGLRSGNQRMQIVSQDALPYLEDVAIPKENVKRIPPDYVFFQNAALPAPVLRDYALQGCINVPRDPDGMIRRLPVVFGFRAMHPETKERLELFVPSFALLSVLRHWDLGPRDVRVEFGDAVTIARHNAPPVRIPIDEQGNMMLNYVGKIHDFQTVSLWHFLSPDMCSPPTARLSTKALKARQTLRNMVTDHIAMVGLTAAGTTDIGPTPLDSNTPFVQVHMTAANSILTGNFIRFSPAIGYWGMAVLFLIHATLASSRSFSRFSWGTLILLLTVTATFYLLLHFHVALVSVVMPVLYLTLGYAATAAYRYFAEVREKRKIRSMFATMVSGEVLQYMEEHPESFSLSGNKTQTTVMFSDLTNFTAKAEKLSPEALSNLLNLYFTEMAEIITANGGYVDKFEGDGIMAEWGVPYFSANHAVAACQAVVAQRDRLHILSSELKRDLGVELQARFGLSSGIVSAGNMGSLHRFQYTVMGDTVNQAARLEPANKYYGTAAIISEETRDLANDAVAVRRLDKILVPGKSLPIVIYELLDYGKPLDAETLALVTAYEGALNLHWQRKWTEALEELDKILKKYPQDTPSVHLHQRVLKMLSSPPASDWNGEFPLPLDKW